jgi:hypothetical protein
MTEKMSSDEFTARKQTGISTKYVSSFDERKLWIEDGEYIIKKERRDRIGSIIRKKRDKEKTGK